MFDLLRHICFYFDYLVISYVELSYPVELEAGVQFYVGATVDYEDNWYYATTNMTTDVAVGGMKARDRLQPDAGAEAEAAAWLREDRYPTCARHA